MKNNMLNLLMVVSGITRCCAIVLIGLVVNCSAQDWIAQAPYPADVDLLSVHFVNETTGFISGRDDLLMKTTDGGQSWLQTNSIGRSPQFSEDPIWKTYFVDDQHGWAWGNNGYRTVDGGESWQSLPFVATVYDIQFLDTQNGFIISNLSVYRTNDGGQTVTSVWDWQNFSFVSDASFVSPNEGLMLTSENDIPGVFKTTDSGQSWQRISNQVLSQILHVDNDTIVGSIGGKFYLSTNGGVDWTMTQDDSLAGGFNNAMEEMTRIDDDSIAAIDINSRIWISDDAGQTWNLTRDYFGNWGFGWDIQFPSADVGYAAGKLGLIFKTIDGGHTWNQLSNGAATQLNDIVMQSNGIGLAVGFNGVILRTENFGQQWDILPQITNGPFSIDLKDVQKIDENSFVTGGDRFLSSHDGGNTWTLGGVLPGGINGLSFLSESEGWACGEYLQPGFFISKTMDGGATWQTLQQDLNTRVPTKIQIHPSGKGYAIFPQTEQVLTDDGYVDSFIPRFLPSGESWQSFEYGSEDVGWYGGFFGTVLRSDNGGFILEEEGLLPGWVFSGGGTGHRLTDIRALSEEQAYITGYRPGAIYQGVIYERVNNAWQPLELISVSTNQIAGAIHATEVLDSGEIWTLGGSGFIFASDIPGLIVGDVNGDGEVNLLDVQPFVDLLASGQFSQAADINVDGEVNLLDVTPFVELLSDN